MPPASHFSTHQQPSFNPMRFPTSSASLNAQEAKPAIVQAAKRNCTWYKNEIKRLAILVTQDSETYAKTVKEFKDGETWKQEYKTWGHACREVLDISPQRAHQLASKLTEVYPDSMSTDLSTPLDNTSHKVKSVSLKVVEPPSPAEPKEEEPEKPAVHSADEKKQPEPKAHTNGQVKLKLPTDVTGCVIPQQNLGAVERADEVKAAMVCASTLKTLFEKVQNEADPLFSHVKHSGNTQTFMTGAASMYFALRDCLPEVVCPQCGGKSADCHYCFGAGWICKVKWDREWVKSNDRIKQVEVCKRAANLK